jgi:uncharacterized membrane protein YeaQ/YmgE (transglycosylase-associated protein family)
MTVVDVVGYIVIGLIVGLIARFLVPGRDPMGCIGTMVLGIVGAFVGGFLSSLIWPPAPGTGYVRPGFLVSLVGAILVLLVFRAFRRKTTAP